MNWKKQFLVPRFHFFWLPFLGENNCKSESVLISAWIRKGKNSPRVYQNLSRFRRFPWKRENILVRLRSESNNGSYFICVPSVSDIGKMICSWQAFQILRKFYRLPIFKEYCKLCVCLLVEVVFIIESSNAIEKD